MSPELFIVTARGDGVASLRIASDAEPYMESSWVAAFTTALAELAHDEAVRAVVLEGGDRYFVAGASRAALLESSSRADAMGYAAVAARALLALPVPVVAAAAGHAIGGGLLIALWCDVAVLAEEGLYGANFMALGFTPGMGATYAVPEAFGGPLGRELLFTGRLFTGREIRDACCPLSHAIRPRAQVLDHALARARAIAEAPRHTLVLLKQILAARRCDALERALSAEASAHATLFAQAGTFEEIAGRYPPAIRQGDEAP
jgi:polyketide biosynthesis enoyl-CoA hydratase PksI